MAHTILIAGGGTGGHIYPGLAIAQSLKKLDPSLDIHFVGTQNGLESKIIPQNNYPLHFLSIGGLKNTTLLQKIITYLKFPLAFFQTLFLILKLKPSFVFGVGGYSSGPVVLVASLMGIPTGLFESNAVPGITNRILSKFVGACFSLFEETKDYLTSKEVYFYGFPVRGLMELCPPRKSDGKLHVLIFGGSQGARGINTTVSQALVAFAEEFQDIEFVHQTGKLDYPTIAPLYKNLKNVRVMEYLDPIKKYYDESDLIFCRAGASTISELSACGKAAVFIPFPFAADDHQKKNAQSLADKNAAILVDQKDFKKDQFLELVMYFKENRPDIERLEKNIHALYKKDAASKIADYILKKIKQ